MRVLSVRNVHQALPYAVRLLKEHGIQRESRNGTVLVAPWPVTTEYKRPLERVVFWPQRDANPFFHLYESLWMLQGRKDLAPLVRFVKDFGKFSDDGVTLHGAYGYRWRRHFNFDQLSLIAKALMKDPFDRRCVLQMWDARVDGGGVGKDYPCNTMATFQLHTGALDLTVFCRSNDIVWGAYGANAVHFGYLLEYMAAWIGCPVGVYRQVSVNWHAYLDTFKTVEGVPIDAFDNGVWSVPSPMPDPYAEDTVMSLPLSLSGNIEVFDTAVGQLLSHVGTEFMLPRLDNDDEPFIEMCYGLFRAHQAWRKLPAPERYDAALELIDRMNQRIDWVAASRQWMARRRDNWEQKMRGRATAVAQ